MAQPVVACYSSRRKLTQSTAEGSRERGMCEVGHHISQHLTVAPLDADRGSSSVSLGLGDPPWVLGEQLTLPGFWGSSSLSLGPGGPCKRGLGLRPDQVSTGAGNPRCGRQGEGDKASRRGRGDEEDAGGGGRRWPGAAVTALACSGGLSSPGSDARSPRPRCRQGCGPGVPCPPVRQRDPVSSWLSLCLFIHIPFR